MKKQSKIITAFVLVLTLVLAVNLLAGCNLGEIYDDDAKIATSNSHSAMNLKTNVAGSEATASAKKFSGAMNLARLEVSTGAISFAYNCTVAEGGRFKLVAVKDDVVTTLFEGEDSSFSLTVELENGTYLLKMVGDQADFEMKIRVTGITLK